MAHTKSQCLEPVLQTHHCTSDVGSTIRIEGNPARQEGEIGAPERYRDVGTNSLKATPLDAELQPARDVVAGDGLVPHAVDTTCPPLEDSQEGKVLVDSEDRSSEARLEVVPVDPLDSSRDAELEPVADLPGRSDVDLFPTVRKKHEATQSEVPIERLRPPCIDGRDDIVVFGHHLDVDEAIALRLSSGLGRERDEGEDDDTSRTKHNVLPIFGRA